MHRYWQPLADQMSRRVAVGTATDLEIRRYVHDIPDDVRAAVPFLRSQRLAWFAHAPETRWPFGELDSVAGQRPASTVRVVLRSPRGTVTLRTLELVVRPR